MLTTIRKKKRSGSAARRVRLRRGGSVEKVVPWLTALVLASAGLHLLGVRLPFVNWIEQWDGSAGWVIRVAVVTVAIVLFALSARQLQQKTV